MIKKFDDFSEDIVKDNEINHYERELSARKINRENLFNDREVSLDEIIFNIKNEIDMGSNYQLSVGKSELTKMGKSVDKIHIQYDSDKLGRIKIYKPKDNSMWGEFEVYGKTFKTSADVIRNFYHYLNQIIKNKPINEGLRDKMVGVSKDEIKKKTDSLEPNQKILYGSKYPSLTWLVEEGIEEGGNVNFLNGTPIQLATGNNDLETIKTLVENGADYRVGGGYPIRYASEFGFVDIVKYLVDLGADVHSYDNYAIDLAIEKDNLDVLKILVSSKNFDKGYIGGMITKADTFRRKDIVDFLKSVN